ncbi:LacI family transcriptional regulator [Bifidobacterium ramosum]|uniref:LacI family transcriptional regulator n=1 Tax=Bifidobacterium ramosum TaxID=1798158 RepID=A0A6L4X225_9BIFI|nr:LacI family transcriptional regulator [Bifidobacterium ramosum]NEG72283.1 hypothetical protein [Bifidobacterium ramosum]
MVAFNDQLAIGALFALRNAGFDVPGSVQVIGFDNIEEAQYLQIPLTTMDSYLDWTAPIAVDRILARIGSNGASVGPELLTCESACHRACDYAVTLVRCGVPLRCGVRRRGDAVPLHRAAVFRPGRDPTLVCGGMMACV